MATDEDAVVIVGGLIKPEMVEITFITEIETFITKEGNTADRKSMPSLPP